MERVIGDPISSAMWASETFESQDRWERASTAIKECLRVDDWVVHQDKNSLVWIADSLTVTAEHRKTSPLAQFKISIELFRNFSDDEDGYFLANSLNYKVVGGTYIFDSDRNALDFVSYCAVATWFDFALLLISAKTAIGQCEVLSRREDTLRFAKCESASRSHPDFGVRTVSHDLFADRLWDLTQIDYVAGLWLSERERDGVFQRIAEECTWVEVQKGWQQESTSRIIELMDFGFQIFVDPDLLHVLKGNSAFAWTSLNAWTDFGRSIVINLGVPFFTLPGLVDDGASHFEAVLLANALNIGSSDVCVQKLGLGTWFAKGSQLCFSMKIPHANLKPVLLGTDRYEIADLIFDVINPNMTYRVLRSAVSNLNAIGRVSEREPQEMDSVSSISRIQNKIDLVRASYETIKSLGLPEVFWDLPSRPLFVYGVFNPVGPSLGSVELVYTADKTIIMSRCRHPFSPNEEILLLLDETDDLQRGIESSIAKLHECTSLPDFIHIPSDLSPTIRNAVVEGLSKMCEELADSGTDLSMRARQIQHQPNPWWRSSDTDVRFVPELENLAPAAAYLRTVTNVDLVDYNLGFFEAWWQGALAFVADPEDPENATAVVERYSEHTLDRLRGFEQT